MSEWTQEEWDAFHNCPCPEPVGEVTILERWEKMPNGGYRRTVEVEPDEDSTLRVGPDGVLTLCPEPRACAPVSCPPEVREVLGQWERRSKADYRPE